MSNGKTLSGTGTKVSLITSNLFKGCFTKLVEKSLSVDIVTAWMTPNFVWNTLFQNKAKNSQFKARIVLGLNLRYPSTNPKDLRGVPLWAELKIKPSEDCLFHHKMYIFHLPNDKAHILIGSANFTQGGMENNDEVLAHFVQRSSTSPFCEQFEKLRKESLSLAKANDLIETYIWRYNSIPKGVHGSINLGSPGSKIGLTTLPPLPLGEPDWNDYYNLLKSARFSHGNKNLFIKDLNDTLFDQAKKIRDSVHPWNSIDLEILSGINPYAFLGRQGRHKNVIRDEQKQIQKAFKLVKKGDIDSVLDSLKALLKIKGIGPSVATRLLSLCFPDLAFCFNDLSEKRLREILSINGDPIMLPNWYLERFRKPGEKFDYWEEFRDYATLLHWFYSRRWYQSECPSTEDSCEKESWENRLALIDIIAYDRGLQKASWDKFIRLSKQYPKGGIGWVI